MRSKVSVIIPTYNRAEYITHAIDSALEQSYPALEIIVVDDVSTDDTSILMRERYGTNPLVRYVPLSENLGPSGAREVGVQNAFGDVIAFLDSDDVWLPNHLSVTMQVFEACPQAAVVLTQRGQIDKRGSITRDLIAEPLPVKISDVLLKRSIFHPSRLALRKAVWLELLAETPQIVPRPRFAEDYYCGVCLVHNHGGNVVTLPDRTVWMRTHENQSFHDVLGLKSALLKAVDQIFASFPDLLPFERQTRAANLFHAAYFLWRAGAWGEAWWTFGEGIVSSPESIALPDFWITLSRLWVLPTLVSRVRGVR